ncbi:MAG: insulinase family protein [Phycisphaerales bacterium]|nr:insulinase family protein [Planctomycetota bacterium]MCH8509550.1 insulinase family protein [Phycisphaerales bacterium]
MRKPFSLAAFGMLLATGPALAQQVEPIEFTLDNGMKFLLLQRDEQPNVITAGWITPAGSTNERPGITGISHMLEHLLFKGSDTIGTSDPEQDRDFRERLTEIRRQMRTMVFEVQYPRFFRGEIDNPWMPSNDTPELRELRARMTQLQDEQRAITVQNEFDRIYTGEGASGMNAGTGHDFTIYYINLPSNKLELWTWMESDRLLDPSFRELDAERFVVVEERRQRLEATPTGILDERFDAMFWVASAYSWPVIGWMSDLMAYTEDEIVEYFETHYQPANLTGVIVGDFNPDEARQLIESYFGRLENKRPPPDPVVTYEVPLRGELRFSGECDCQDRVEVRYRAVPAGHPDGPALDVLADLLNGRTGRLYRSLIEDQGLASSARASNRMQRSVGSFSFFANPRGGAALTDLEQAWYEQVERLKSEPVGERELQKVKNQAAADSFRQLSDNANLFFQLAIYEAWVGWEELNEYPRRIQEVTPEDIMRVAQTYLVDDNKGVALYTRRQAGERPMITLEDVEASLPEEIREMIMSQFRGQLAELAAETDIEKLRESSEQLRQQASAMPPQFKTMFDFVQQEIDRRIAEIEGGAE